MNGALNGRGPATTRNPIREMELGGLEMPVGERSPALEALNARLAKVTRALDPEVALAVHTAFLAGWRDSWLHSASIRAAEARAAMDDRPEPLSSHVVAVVESRVPDAPESVGRGGVVAEPLDLEHLGKLHETYRAEGNVHVRIDAARALSGLLFARLTEILAALERIPELERRLDEAIDQNMHQATRQERLEAAARVVAYADVRICGLCRPDRYHEHSADCPVMALRAALAPAPEGSEPPSDDTAERAIGRFVQERRRDGWEVLLERGDVTERMVLPGPASGEEGEG